MSKYSEAQKNAIMKYQKEHLEQINIRVKKGCKQKYLDAAAARGQSLAQFLTDAADAAIDRDSIRPAAPDAEGPAAPAAEPEPSSQKTKNHTPDLEAVDLQRLLTDARYQLDIMDIYGQEQTQRLLDQARSK
jgi:predicted  nucleic acid-binding Zn-ribbon protein